MEMDEKRVRDHWCIWGIQRHRCKLSCIPRKDLTLVVGLSSASLLVPTHLHLSRWPWTPEWSATLQRWLKPPREPCCTLHQGEGWLPGCSKAGLCMRIWCYSKIAADTMQTDLVPSTGHRPLVRLEPGLMAHSGHVSTQTILAQRRHGQQIHCVSLSLALPFWLYSFPFQDVAADYACSACSQAMMTNPRDTR